MLRRLVYLWKMETTTSSWDTPPRARLMAQLQKPWNLRLFMLMKLPAGLIAGLRIRAVNYHGCTVSVPYKWLNTNPFRSTYFAVLSMAAEMSTGVLAMIAIEGAKPSVSMLVSHLEADFVKKAAGTTFFTCTQGDLIFEAAQKAMSGEPATVDVTTTGRNTEGEEVARFVIRWTFKARSA